MSRTASISTRMIVALVGCAILAGCQSTGPKRDSSGDSESATETAILEPIQEGLFIPTNFIARMHFEDGQYPNLMAPSTHAIWVDEHISDIKLAYEEAQGNADVPPEYVNAANMINDSFIVIECHVDSLFPDTSIAYDVSSLRNLNVYLESDTGRKIYPIQKILGSTASEEQVGALKRYERLNLLVFPTVDVITEQPTIEVGTQSMQLVIEGFDSRYTFTWLGEVPAGPLPESDPNAPTAADVFNWRPTQSETVQVLKLRFTDMIEKLAALTRVPQG